MNAPIDNLWFDTETGEVWCRSGNTNIRLAGPDTQMFSVPQQLLIDIRAYLQNPIGEPAAEPYQVRTNRHALFDAVSEILEPNGGARAIIDDDIPY